MSKYQQLLPSSFCQLTIDGQSWSNTCSVIATVFTKFALTGLLHDDAETTEMLMRSAMIEGNSLYGDDRTAIQG